MMVKGKIEADKYVEDFKEINHKIFVWLGGDSCKTHEIIDILTDIALGEYTPERFKKDVEDAYVEEDE